MEVITHKCPNCGGPLTFNPDDQKFHCDFCLSEFTEAEVTAFEAQQKAARLVADEPSPTVEGTGATADAKDTTVPQAATDATSASNLELFTCPSCGAEIVTDATTAATYCYFCHNPVVLTGRLAGTFQPEKVLPFAISKEKAEAEFLNWTKKKKFIPKDFFDEKQIQLLTGVYFPYWVVDAELDGQFRANATSLRVWRVGDLEYTETKQYAIYRQGKLSFKNLVKNALTKNVQKNMVTSVQPFPLDKAVSFHSQYLAGFQAEKRDIEFNALQESVQKELQNYSQNLLQETASQYTTVTGKQSNIKTQQQENHYVLLPVWLVTYQNRGDKKVYYYAMNGQTGKTAGVLPISLQRLGLACGGIFAALFALFLLGGYLL